ncbi:hypothetical protein Tco_0814599 [Tanacetum coccineum]
MNDFVRPKCRCFGWPTAMHMGVKHSCLLRYDQDLNRLMRVVFKRVYYFNMVCGDVICYDTVSWILTRYARMSVYQDDEDAGDDDINHGHCDLTIIKMPFFNKKTAFSNKLKEAQSGGDKVSHHVHHHRQSTCAVHLRHVLIASEVVCLGVWGGGWGGWLCGGGREVGGSGDGEEWPVAGRNGARGVTCGDWESGGVAEGECGGGERWGRGGERGTDGVGEEMGCQVGGSGWEDEGGALRRSSRRCRGGEFGGGVVGCEGG